MKIVLLSYHSGIVYRGAETFCDALASNLSANHEVTVFQSKTFPIKKNYQIIEIDTNYKKDQPKSFLKYFGLDFYNRKILLFTLKSLSYISKINPKIIIPISGRWMSLIIKLYTLFTKSKMVISGQAGLGLDEKWNLFLQPNLFVSLSVRNDKWVKKYFPHQKTVIIPNGVDLEKFKLGVCKKPNPFSLTRPIILCVAGPEKYKRVEETIRAVSFLLQQKNKVSSSSRLSLRNSTSGISLIVLGGNEKTLTLGQKLLGKNFKQTKIPHDKLPEIYNSADLFTLVSETTEAFGISYLEALACNLPVVATNDELRHEIIGNSGLFISDPKNFQEYAKIIKNVLETNWKNLPRIQAEKFDWFKISQSYEKEFKKLIIK